MLVKLTGQQRDALVVIIDNATIQGKAAEIIVQLKQALLNPMPDDKDK